MAESHPDEHKQSSSTADLLELPDCLSGLGIECYTTPHLAGFQAVIKSRAEDFVVTEIDSNGRLVQLDQLAPPPPPPPPPPTSDQAAAGDGGRVAKSRPDISEVPLLNELVTQEQYHSLSELVDKMKVTLDPQLKDSVSLGEIADKEKRALVHNAVRVAFPPLLTKTVKNEAGISEIHVLADPKYVPLSKLLGAEDAERLLVFINTAGKSKKLVLQPDPSRQHRTEVHHILSELYGPLLSTKSHTHQHGTGRARKRRKLNDHSAESASEDVPTRIVVTFRGLPPDKRRNEEDQVYTKFSLRKTNMESLEALQRLSEALNCKLSQFSTCGIKDKRAVTTQKVSVKGVTPERLQSVASDPALTGITMANYEYCSQHVVTGEHTGNNFKIVLRNMQCVGHVTSSDDVFSVIPRVTEGIKECGFVNYFGPQRFGSSNYGPKKMISFSGCMIGLAMLKKNYKAAVDMIISTAQDGNSDTIKEAKQHFSSTGDVTGTLEKMPHYQTREYIVLKGLNQHGYTSVGCMSALMGIPHNWRSFYVHCFTSLLWNHLASFRVKEYGLRPVEGDLVLKKVNNNASAKQLTARERVHVLTQHDIHSGQYGLGDIVLPLPGTNTMFPSNRVADKLKELLMLVGLSLASFRINALKIHLSGTYRRLVAYPRQLSWRWLPAEELAATPPAVRNSIALEEKSRNLELSFSLENSCYATVLLREIMKQEIYSK